jgi:hypothetical protein
VTITALDLGISDGTHVTITPPAGGWTTVVRVFGAVHGRRRTDHDRQPSVYRNDLSFGFHGGHWQFQPQFECDGEDDHGDGGEDDD